GQALLSDADDAEVAAVLARTDFASHGPNTPADLDDFLRRLEGTRRRGYSIVDEEASRASTPSPRPGSAQRRR
ncbi:hypothetical protein CTI14_61925, partial [Methylobacterium radiotolerans]